MFMLWHITDFDGDSSMELATENKKPKSIKHYNEDGVFYTTNAGMTGQWLSNVLSACFPICEQKPKGIKHYHEEGHFIVSPDLELPGAKISRFFGVMLGI